MVYFIYLIAEGRRLSVRLNYTLKTSILCTKEYVVCSFNVLVI